MGNKDSCLSKLHKIGQGFLVIIWHTLQHEKEDFRSTVRYTVTSIYILVMDFIDVIITIIYDIIYVCFNRIQKSAFNYTTKLFSMIIYNKP